MRETRRTIELDRLIRTETDAAIVCSVASRMSGMADIAGEIAAFADTHRRHIGELTVAVRRLGAIPAAPRRDLRGVLLQAFSWLRGVSGSPGPTNGIGSSNSPASGSSRNGSGNRRSSPSRRRNA